MTLPCGQIWRFGGLSKVPMAKIAVSDENFFRRTVLFGPIGFAESHVAGEWDSPDLVAVVAFFIANAEESPTMETRSRKRRGPVDLFSAYNRFIHSRRPNSILKSRDNIREHYDLSNEFFALWLDGTMTYSSALFEPNDLPLKDAQIKKYDALCQKLRLTAGDRVLEIGTGWGGFSLHAASTYGCRVVTTTISEQQHHEASKRIAEAGLADRIEVRLEDYRHLTGRFDKIASIEMLEAVGDRYVDGYFEKCSALLSPNGLLGIQAILCPDQQYDVIKRGVDFIQKHIFPGSLLMSMQRILAATGKTRALNLLDYHDMAPHYAKTLRLWREAFDLRLDDIRALGFDEAFLRKWRYYLSYCEAAFATRHITVAQMVFTKFGNLSLNAGSPVGELPIARAR
ncbi:MAG: cyclopropane-fatty-acyl-phospholipid synthase family protein [Terrimicrobiaceae bacterium]